MSCLFCLPAYGMWVTSHFTRSLVNLTRYLDKNGFDYDMTFGADSGVHRCRYYLTETFMQSRYDRMMFIDADIEFEPESFGKLWGLDADVAVGVYRMNDGEPYAAHSGGELLTELPDEPMTVDYAGTGFMLIKRETLEALRPELPVIKTARGNIPRWFDFGLFTDKNGDQIELPEDYTFCQRVRDRGMTIMMDPTVRLRHWKQKAF